MTPEEQAAALLDKLQAYIMPDKSGSTYFHDFRIIAAALAEREERGAESFAQHHHNPIVREKDAEIERLREKEIWLDGLDKTNKENWHRIAVLEAERDQLRERVAELEQQVRVLENPRVTDEDWHKMALMYTERVEELEVDKKVINAAYADLMNSYAAAKIEGLKMALLICENWNHTWEAIKAIEAEISKLEKQSEPERLHHKAQDKEKDRQEG